MFEKAKAWFKATGLTNLGWGAGFAGAMILNWPFVAGGCAFLFVYFNWNWLRNKIKGE